MNSPRSAPSTTVSHYESGHRRNRIIKAEIKARMEDFKSSVIDVSIPRHRHHFAQNYAQTHFRSPNPTVIPTGVSTIIIKLAHPRQLFNSFDPYPFLGDNLDEDAHKYIVAYARDAPSRDEFHIIVKVHRYEPLDEQIQLQIKEAIQNYYLQMAIQTERNLRATLRIGGYNVLIGLAVLVLCITLARLLNPDDESTNTWRMLMVQSLGMLGWVALWNPMDILLYAWWPVLSNIRLYRRISRAQISVQPWANPRN